MSEPALAREFDVYGIGNALLDLQLQASEEDIRALGLKKSGMTLIDSEERARLLGYFDDPEPHRASGGSAANTMIAISQLGGRAAFSFLVGDDENGLHYRREMAALGVAVHSEPHPDGATGTCVVLITPDAERTMSTTLGVSAEFGPGQVSEEAMSRSEWVYLEGYLFSTDRGRAAVNKAIELAHASGTKVALTFSDAFIVQTFGDALRAAVESSDLIFANEVEARAFTGRHDEDEVFEQLRHTAPAVIMTLHERGARAHFNDAEHFFDPFKVDAVDETGAGDVFAGGILYGITNDRSIAEAGRLASFLASRVVSQLGPRLTVNVRDLVRSLDSGQPTRLIDS